MASIPMRLRGKRFQPWWELLHKAALQGMNFGGDDVYSSGETAFLNRHLARLDAPVVVDIGANRGLFSAAVLAANRSATVHAFEPSTTVHAELAARFASDGRVTCWAIGLGSASGAATLSWPTGLDGMASMTRRDLSTHGLEADQTTEINIDTLDRWAASKHVEHISLLKIDVEGHERDVLEGAQGLLDRRAVDAVQFEFGGAAIDTRTYLRDFYRLLGPGFDVCRILPDGLSAPIHESERNEIFLLHNYVALRTR